MITVTLQQIKDAEPCTDLWKKVLAANGGVNADFDKPFPLASILDSNGFNDALWVISAVPGMSEHDEIWREHSRFCALQVIEKIEPYCSSESYELIVKWLETGDDNLREAAESAALSAESAAWSEAWSAAESAARSSWSEAGSVWSAAESAAGSARSARSAAESAAESAAGSARSARSAAESVAWSEAESEAWSSWSEARSVQEAKLRELLVLGE